VAEDAPNYPKQGQFFLATIQRTQGRPLEMFYIRAVSADAAKRRGTFVTARELDAAASLDLMPPRANDAVERRF